MSGPRIGIVGCGAIGSEVAKAIDSGRVGGELTALADVSFENMDTLLSQLNCDPQKIAVNSENLAEGFSEICSQVEVIVEAAGGGVVSALLEAAGSEGVNLVIMSVGGLLTCIDTLERVRSRGIRVVTPSGAIAGLDAVNAAEVGGLETVTLTTRKPPEGLRGAPYLDKVGIDIDSLDGETVIFEGNAFDAVEAFPKNVNVAAALSLAGIGPEKTTVKVVTSPEFTKNSHEVEAIGAFGRLVTRVENVPSPTNPKTSYLAALSGIAALRELAGS